MEKRRCTMKVLLAIDDSTCSSSAVESLIKQSRPAETEVLVLHAIESGKLMPISYSYGMGPIFPQDYTAIVQQWRSEGEALAARAVQRLEAAGFKVSSQVEEGDARDVILNCAQSWHPDLILMGSHGRKGLDRFMLGSVSEAITRHAPCSVEVVRTPAVAA
ncbi:MAG: hypothetical protein DMG65_14005 [Candidatus Angelobacter sp. Gp1-AA117]|nr:MAG: hypothetical protein DMG65_14005 [Candidatus Angelobacter sp. Gp1-AA117]